MKATRRQFLKYCIGSAAALGLSSTVVGRLSRALADGGSGLPTVIWLNGANCTGCTISLANLFLDEPDAPSDIADLLVNHIDLAYHPNLMGAAGDLAVQTLYDAANGPYILAVDGGIPTAFGGHTCMLYTSNGKEYTAREAVELLAPGADHILGIGTCAGFGGIPGAAPNPTGIESVEKITGLPTINIPGCPPHPDWIVSTIAQLIAGASPSLDDNGRPLSLFDPNSMNIHKFCPRRRREEAKTFGRDGGCLRELGCNGPRTAGDCPTRKWNNGTNWCVGANAVCLGCTEPEFPDSFSPFYERGEEGENENEHDEHDRERDD